MGDRDKLPQKGKDAGAVSKAAKTDAVDAFLQKVAAMPKVKAAGPRGRDIIGITLSYSRLWMSCGSPLTLSAIPTVSCLWVAMKSITSIQPARKRSTTSGRFSMMSFVAEMTWVWKSLTIVPNSRSTRPSPSFSRA